MKTAAPELRELYLVHSHKYRDVRYRDITGKEHFVLAQQELEPDFLFVANMLFNRHMVEDLINFLEDWLEEGWLGEE